MDNRILTKSIYYYSPIKTNLTQLSSLQYQNHEPNDHIKTNAFINNLIFFREEPSTSEGFSLFISIIDKILHRISKNQFPLEISFLPFKMDSFPQISIHSIYHMIVPFSYEASSEYSQFMHHSKNSFLYILTIMNNYAYCL